MHQHYPATGKRTWINFGGHKGPPPKGYVWTKGPPSDHAEAAEYDYQFYDPQVPGWFEALPSDPGTWLYCRLPTGAERIALQCLENFQTLRKAFPRKPRVHVDCACGNHKIDPDGDPYEQHREWIAAYWPWKAEGATVPEVSAVAKARGVGASAPTMTLAVDDPTGDDVCGWA